MSDHPSKSHQRGVGIVGKDGGNGGRSDGLGKRGSGLGTESCSMGVGIGAKMFGLLSSSPSLPSHWPNEKRMRGRAIDLGRVGYRVQPKTISCGQPSSIVG